LLITYTDKQSANINKKNKNMYLVKTTNGYYDNVSNIKISMNNAFLFFAYGIQDNISIRTIDIVKIMKT